MAQFSMPQPTGEQTLIDINWGDIVFVLGANGTGKSLLLQRITAQLGTRARRISANRQTWLQSSEVEFSPSQRNSYEQQKANWDNAAQSRYMEQNAQIRSGLTLYNLVNADNIDARRIAQTLRSGNIEAAQLLASQIAPIAKINELLSQSNIPVVISVDENSKLLASKNGSTPYGAAELSDGERNALLIAADVLTASTNTILIIDEPERHLHRSIISPLLSQLFRFRNDCAFIIATHDLLLPVDNPDARVLLVRSCVFVNSTAQSWVSDLLPANADLDDELKQDIIGARRRMVFVEGTESILDHPLYSLIFPDISLRSKGSSRDVEQAVKGLRSSESAHWMKVWGIIDNDGRDASKVATLMAEGIFPLTFYSVESIYYHPYLIRCVAERHALVVGGDAAQRADAAIASAFESIAPHFERLAARGVEKKVRATFFERLPTMDTLQSRQAINVHIDTAIIIDAEIASLRAAMANNDWVYVLASCPIRETRALDNIARAIGLRDKYQYESAVLQAIRDDPNALRQVRSFFGTLPAELGIT